jgi:hypothetical protein
MNIDKYVLEEVIDNVVGLLLGVYDYEETRTREFFVVGSSRIHIVMFSKLDNKLEYFWKENNGEFSMVMLSYDNFTDRIGEAIVGITKVIQETIK